MTTAVRTLWLQIAALVAGVAAVGGFIGCSGPETAPRTAALVDARLPLTSEGADFAFTVAERCDVRLWVQLEGCCVETRGEATLSRLLPAKRPTLVYEPEADEALVLAIGAAPAESEPWTLEHPGAYAVRIPPVPTAMGEGMAIAHVLVERVP